MDDRQPKSGKLSKPLILGICAASMCFAATYISCQPVRKEDQEKFFPSVSALTSDQKTSVNDVIVAISRIESAAIELKGLGTVPPITDSIEQDFKSALSSTSCQIAYSRATTTMGPRESTLQIGGTGCPVVANYSSKYLAGTPAGPYSLVATFQVTETMLRQKNDVVSINLQGTGTHSFSNSNRNDSTDASGDVVTLNKGTVKISISNHQTTVFNNSGNTVTGTKSIRLSFPVSAAHKTAFSAAIKVDFDIGQNQDRSRYQINGSDISKAEFDSYFQKLGILAL